MFGIRIDDELELALLEERHAPELFALVDANREHLRRWLPWVAATRGVDDSRAFLRSALEQFARGDGFHLGVRERGRLVGMVGLHYLRLETSRTEIGYWLAADAAGRGIATRAVAFLCERFFGEYGLNRVEIRCEPDNARSCGVAERLGFTLEGVLREVAVNDGNDDGGGRRERADHRVYGMLAREWNERQERTR